MAKYYPRSNVWYGPQTSVLYEIQEIDQGLYYYYNGDFWFRTDEHPRKYGLVWVCVL